MPSLLITDCLQHDFVGPIGRFQGLPNALHVGHDESLRLLGPNPDEGPVARVLSWAHAQPDHELKVIHVRDWHDPGDPVQRAHLRQFGQHCVRDTPGAGFVFALDRSSPAKVVDIVEATTLSNFVGAGLGEKLQSYAGDALRVGLMGVWTEAKISFLAYDLRVRYPEFELAVCSALTASSSRQSHFLALDQLERILGVRIIDSVGEFVDFLGGQLEQAPLIGFSDKHPSLRLADGTQLSDTDRKLVRYLFRGCREVAVKSLDGGFSGNSVLGTSSVDLHGHEEVPHVVKIGQKGPIGQERTVFERIESVMGNSAPRITDFADLEERGAIKYRYAAMGRGAARSFQKLYEGGAPKSQIDSILDTIFLEQLGRFYRAAELERVDLLDYYDFKPKWAASVRGKVHEVLGTPAEQDSLLFPNGRRLPNPALFYECILQSPPRQNRSHYFSYIHGDLNGANIIVDAQSNTWLIDFFHAHRGHVLKDLIKLENDLLYIFTKIDNEAELLEAMHLTELLVSMEDLARPLAEPIGISSPKLLRCYATLCRLRSYYPELIKADRDPYQTLVGQLRYAMHTLGFDESSTWQKRWALYTAAQAAAAVNRRLKAAGPLRIDWLPDNYGQPGKVGLTIVPGRKDYGRNLDDDLRVLREEGVGAVLCLLSRDEFVRYGVEDLLVRYRSLGMDVLHIPTVDGRVPSDAELSQAAGWISARSGEGVRVLAHCVGGLGRAGTVAACWLRSKGLAPEEAIAVVRAARSQRAIETSLQEQTITRFGMHS